MSWEAQYQREVNRALDADRNTRKKGLQKLLESLPWDKKSIKAELIKFVEDHLLKLCIAGISDQVEKCREYSLKILKSYFGLLLKKNPVAPDVLQSLLQALYARVNDNPFPEVAEELRLLALELLVIVFHRIKPLLKDSAPQSDEAQESASLFPLFREDLERLVVAIAKALGDNFPAVKRAAAELVVLMCASKAMRVILRSHSKTLVRALIANINHQHSKTRSVTLQAIVSLLLVLQSQDSFVSLWKESVYPALQRLLSDRTPSVRKDMADELARLLLARIASAEKNQQRLIVEDLQIVLLLLLLCGDDVEEIGVSARRLVVDTVRTWKNVGVSETAMDVDESIENGEMALREHEAQTGGMKIDVVDSSAHLRGFLGLLQTSHGEQLLQMLLQHTAEQWTVEGKGQSLRGLSSLFSVVLDLLHGAGSASATAATEAAAASSGMDVAGEDANDHAAASAAMGGAEEVTRDAVAAIATLLESQLPSLVAHLLPLMRHEEDAIRHAAESTAQSIGKLFPIAAAPQTTLGSSMHVWLDLLLPRVRGELSGTDTSSYRSMAIRLATQLYRGSIASSDFADDAVVHTWRHYVADMVASLARQRLLWSQFHADLAVKEAILLYLRTIFATHQTPLPGEKSFVQMVHVVPKSVQRDVAQIYLYMMSAPAVTSLAAQYQQGALGSAATANLHVGGGNGDIERIARGDFLRFVHSYQMEQDAAGTSSSAAKTSTAAGAAAAAAAKRDETEDLVAIGRVLQPHFLSLFVRIVSPHLVANKGAGPSLAASTASASDEGSDHDEAWAAVLRSGAYAVRWETMSVDLLCLQTLCQFCLLETWRQWAIVLPFVAQLADPSHGVVAPGSMKDTMISYASQRGEDTALTQETLISYDQRMHVLILLEQLIRVGTTSGHFWEAGASISQSTAVLMTRIFLPNLIWRVGRVEATIRKIALAGVYALLKAGAIPRDVILSVARDTLPVLVSHLDDTDVSPRLMACLSLAVFFARLGAQGCVGVWDELGLKDIYPKFLARLDDSQDEVRMAACQLLSAFVVAVCGRVPANQAATRGSKLMSDTMVEYIVDQLFIHLDDMNQAMQERVFDVLLTIALQCEGDAIHHQLSPQHLPKDFAAVITKKAEQQKLSHRSPRWCEKLVAEIERSLHEAG